MSHAHGTNLGGIRTLDDLKARCVIDDITECWHWTLAMWKNAPRVHLLTPDTGRKITARGRRAALYLARGEDMPRGHVAFARLGCTSADCCNPEHCRSGTKKAWGKYLKQSGRVKGLPSKCVGARKAWDKRGRTLTPDMVAQIRNNTTATTRELAQQLGITQYAIWSVLNGLTHRPLMRGASIFNQGATCLKPPRPAA